MAVEVSTGLGAGYFAPHVSSKIEHSTHSDFGRSDPCLLRISFDLVLISVGQFASLIYG